MLDLLRLLGVELLDHWPAFCSGFTARGPQLEAILLVLLITTELDAVGEVGLVVLSVITSILSLVIDAEEVLTADRHGISLVSLVGGVIRCRGYL